MTIKKTTIAAAAALIMGLSGTAYAGSSVDHVTAETMPSVFGAKHHESLMTKQTPDVNRVTSETMPSVFGEYRPDNWERTGKQDEKSIPYQKG